ncbi:MAG: hypothetical protein LWX83_14660, partial [Anaerolineae bacterium]|nr:hypothetical protein [Anaerolineae bacterium]
MGQSLYGYTGEAQDGTIKLVNLRARLYSTEMGRFLTKDAWPGNYNLPESYNKWLYTYANPVNLTDPSGHDPWSYICDNLPEQERLACYASFMRNRGSNIELTNCGSTQTPPNTISDPNRLSLISMPENLKEDGEKGFYGLEVL